MKCIICDTEFEPTHNRHLKYCSEKCAKEGYNRKKRRLYAKNSKNEKDKQLKQSTNYALKSKYGITLKDYNLMSKAQEGVCMICNQRETIINNKKSISRLSVDHNHKTGKIRGLLCHRCNRALGYFNDNPLILIKAIEYLKT